MKNPNDDSNEGDSASSVSSQNRVPSTIDYKDQILSLSRLQQGERVMARDATREAMESRQEMLDEFGSERFLDDEAPETTQFTIDDEDDDML